MFCWIVGPWHDFVHSRNKTIKRFTYAVINRWIPIKLKCKVRRDMMRVFVCFSRQFNLLWPTRLQWRMSAAEIYVLFRYYISDKIKTVFINIKRTLSSGPIIISCLTLQKRSVIVNYNPSRIVELKLFLAQCRIKKVIATYIRFKDLCLSFFFWGNFIPPAALIWCSGY